MAGATVPDNIPYMTTGDGVIDTAYTEALAEAVQGALDTRAIRSFRWANASDRTVQTGMLAGDVGYQIDTAVRYSYNGTAWVVNTDAMILLNSTTATGASSQSINSVFSSSFRNYLVIIDGVGSVSNSINMRLRVAGVDSATNYGYQVLQGSGAVTTSIQSGATTAVQASGTGTRHSSKVEIFSPGLVSSSQMIVNALSSISTSSQALVGVGGYHSTATAYDGFTLLATSGTFTGVIKVYGYA